MGDTVLVAELKRRMKALGTNPKKLSKDARLNETAVRDILEGKSKHPRTDTVAKLARALGCTVAELTGESQHLESSDVASGLAEEKAPYSIGSQVLIRELDVRAAQGPHGMTPEVLEQNLDEHTKAQWGFPRDGFLQMFGAAPDGVQIIEAVGDSNTPEILPGQRVMVHVRDRTPTPPGFFALWDGLGVVIKRVQYIANSDPPRIKISSANPAYDSYERNLDEAHILGRVLGNWRRL